ncbi:MAG TPA: CocE/NonD family hydrolase [Candidatus Hydrogenedentes bacterium]|nr:CocE/NonD family hydrolase [Candidatus Hydrogenedentota bacterium]
MKKTFYRKSAGLFLALVYAFSAGALLSNQTTLGTRTFHKVPMTDGTLLATDVYLPDGDGPFPVVLIRSTYSRNQNMNGYIEKGCAAVIQDIRGMGGSEGEPHVFYYDGWRPGVTDGADTVAWIKAQTWCNGRIATAGGSALGMTQMLLAPATTDICAQYIQVSPSNYYFDVVYLGGVFRKNLVEGWLWAVGQPQTIKIYRDIPRYNEFWSYYNTIEAADRITAPAMFVNGWYDIFSQGTIDGFVAREERGGEGARGNNYLIMTWAPHGPDTSPDYALNENRHSLCASKLRDKFFAYHLAGDAAALDALPKVHYYVMGADTPDAPGNEWRTADKWPPLPAQETAFYLTAGGALEPDPPGEQSFLEFVFDPADPYPTWGGANLLPNLVSGPYDQRKYSATRNDLLKFASAPLKEPLEIVGKVKARLFVSSDAPDTDFTAKLLDIFPEGDDREILMLDNIRRVKTRQGFDRIAPPLQGHDDIVEIEVDLWSIAWVFDKGHRIGLHLSSSNYPRFDVNPNTGADHPAPDEEMRTARNRVHTGAAKASALLLPVTAR